MPEKETSIIKVIGVGGGGGNAVHHMFEQGIIGVDFAICNTDHQALETNVVPTKIKLGPNLTEGRGAGSKPEVGKQACIESVDEIRRFLEQGTKMVFITAGMGGGTGTGAAPIIAKVAQELEILTVGIVTLPFKFEGIKRRRFAAEGLENLKKHVDAILVISNDKVKEMFGQLALSDAFAQADNILATAAKGIAEIITVPGKINVDFEDVNTVMRNSGVAIMGSGSATGEDRARKAIHMALNSPLLEDNDIRGAQHILLNITSGKEEVTMDEIGEITEYVEEEAGYGTNLIWGHCKDESIDEKLNVTLIATGFKEGGIARAEAAKEEAKYVTLDSEKEAEPIFDLDPQDSSTIIFDIKETYREQAPSLFEEKIEDSLTVQDDQPKTAEHFKKELEMDLARRQYLREHNTKPLDDPKVINELESEPAFKRRNVELDDVDNANRTMASSDLSIGIDLDQPIVERRNTFLHDNVD